MADTTEEKALDASPQEEAKEASQSGRKVKKTKVTTTANKENGNIFSQLLKAQAEMPAIPKNHVNPFSKSKYADLTDIMNVVRPVLNANGLFLTQTLNRDPGASDVLVETEIFNANGDSICGGLIAVPLVGNNPAQALGAASTYGKRYSLCALLGISADDDSDGAMKPNVVVNDALKSMVETAAANGAEAYKKCYASLNKEQRQQLVNSGLHQQIKKRLGLEKE